jgi:flagellar assembly protein FliH
LSRRIIKAGWTRLLPAEKRLYKSHKAGADEDETVVSTAADDLQSAYDEVIEAAQQEMDLMLSDARMEAGEIVKTAGTEAEKIRQAAYAEGLEDGYARGYADFLANSEKAVQALMDEGQGEVDKALANAYDERDRLLDEMEPRVLRLALDIGEKILGYELDGNNEAFVSLVTTALNVMKSEGRVTLRVNAKQHMASFRSRADALLKTDQGVVQAEISSDPGVEPGGCIIETGNGIVDASVDAQLEQISRNLGFG